MNTFQSLQEKLFRTKPTMREGGQSLILPSVDLKPSKHLPLSKELGSGLDVQAYSHPTDPDKVILKPNTPGILSVRKEGYDNAKEAANNLPFSDGPQIVVPLVYDRESQEKLIVQKARGISLDPSELVSDLDGQKYSRTPNFVKYTLGLIPIETRFQTLKTIFSWMDTLHKLPSHPVWGDVKASAWWFESTENPNQPNIWLIDPPQYSIDEASKSSTESAFLLEKNQTKAIHKLITTTLNPFSIPDHLLSPHIDKAILVKNGIEDIHTFFDIYKEIQKSFGYLSGPIKQQHQKELTNIEETLSLSELLFGYSLVSPQKSLPESVSSLRTDTLRIITPDLVSLTSLDRFSRVGENSPIATEVKTLNKWGTIRSFFNISAKSGFFPPLEYVAIKFSEGVENYRQQFIQLQGLTPTTSSEEITLYLARGEHADIIVTRPDSQSKSYVLTPMIQGEDTELFLQDILSP